MEINGIVNPALLHRSPTDKTSDDTGSRHLASGAGSLSKQVSRSQAQSTLVISPPTPVPETGPEDNTVQNKESQSGRHLSLEV